MSFEPQKLYIMDKEHSFLIDALRKALQLSVIATIARLSRNSFMFREIEGPVNQARQAKPIRAS